MPGKAFSRRLPTLNSLQPPDADMQEAGLTPISSPERVHKKRLRLHLYGNACPGRRSQAVRGS